MVFQILNCIIYHARRNLELPFQIGRKLLQDLFAKHNLMLVYANFKYRMT